ncbi:hypothetical protein [Candidatus Reidiella endopervernicosa]|uniref:Uncharacterized protein n=1 Tax=Candidatus Reidiella endopervernicosa TaxID=2738883 RepID=A0A6N0HT68_9GAMM|nr:hypothetical protein [Candidatus Reidiella endopervernicosa]QKQ25407.1 hypothetical protein HUE57_03190 [Candidatus Reidiella endopervernicosa]
MIRRFIYLPLFALLITLPVVGCSTLDGAKTTGGAKSSNRGSSGHVGVKIGF